MKILMAIAIILLSTWTFAQDGAVVLVGGGNIPNKVVLFVKDKCKTNKILVVISNKEYGQRWKDLFGEPLFFFPDELKLEDLDGIGGIILSGGDQFVYLQKLNPKIIDEAHKRGICILGTSAGAMVISENYFSAAEGTVTSEEALAGQHVCLGSNFVSLNIFKSTIIDTHYTERNRQGRLKVFMEKSKSNFGIGIDEATALCIEGERREVFGEGKVFIFNNSKVEILCQNN